MTTVGVLPSGLVGMAAEGKCSNHPASRRSTAEKGELAYIEAQIENAQTLAEILEDVAGQHEAIRTLITPNVSIAR